MLAQGMVQGGDSQPGWLPRALFIRNIDVTGNLARPSYQ
jgi:hypothetical protein